MMKKTILLLLCTNLSAAFEIAPRRTNRLTVLRAEKQKTSSSSQTSATPNEDKVLARFQKEWEEEAAHQNAMEHSVETDPDLHNLVEHKKPIQKVYMEKEAHKHDSLFHEIEHAIDTDPDLANIAQGHNKKRINKEFMEKEAHKHRSLLDEVEHSIDTDPYVS